MDLLRAPGAQTQAAPTGEDQPTHNPVGSATPAPKALPMTPAQLRELADKFEQSAPPPWLSQTPSDYQVSDIAHKMARFLREIAEKA